MSEVLPLRFYPVMNATTKELLAVEDDDQKAFDTARAEARRNPGAVIVVMEPKEAFRAGERPVSKVWLAWPPSAEEAAALPALPAGEPAAVVIDPNPFDGEI